MRPCNQRPMFQSARCPACPTFCLACLECEEKEKKTNGLEVDRQDHLYFVED
jgi:hypothetical protein